MRNSLVSAAFLATLCLHAQTVTPAVQHGLDSIRPSELRGDLSFLASDALQGRYTPSPGLEMAAEFIASKFRAIGLEPAGNSGYFQLAPMVDRKLPKMTSPVVVRGGDKTLTIEPGAVQVSKASAAAQIKSATVLKISDADPEKLKGLDMDGKVILFAMPDFATVAASHRMAVYEKMQAFEKAVASSKAVAEIAITNGAGRSVSSRLLPADEAGEVAPPEVQVNSAELATDLSNSTPLTASLDIPAPQDQQVTVKNVIGLLHGSDPTLRTTCVLVTAHYDHIGTADTAGGLAESKSDGRDKIFNGANDDGSGTVSVIEIARALAQLHPKRSILFITFFGEERGLLGSTWYGRNPVFPIARTVADINLEQVGRTDSTEGPEISNASVTGFDYSDVTKYLENAGAVTGVKIYEDPSASDPYFVRSDNAALALQGVPAHTLCTAFDYPDYHGVGDEWQKIDYDNMAKVDRTVALAVLRIADSGKVPQWNAQNPKTLEFREAQKAQSTR
jgi:hypothetical protein